MRCAKCGADVKPTDTCCPNCSQICTEIQTIQDVRSEYDQQEQTAEGYYEYKSAGPGRRIHIKQFNFSRMGIWSTLLGIIILAVIIILALPLAILLSLIFSVWWFLMRRR